VEQGVVKKEAEKIKIESEAVRKEDNLSDPVASRVSQSVEGPAIFETFKMSKDSLGNSYKKKKFPYNKRENKKLKGPKPERVSIISETLANEDEMSQDRFGTEARKTWAKQKNSQYQFDGIQLPKRPNGIKKTKANMNKNEKIMKDSRLSDLESTTISPIPDVQTEPVLLPQDGPIKQQINNSEEMTKEIHGPNKQPPHQILTNQDLIDDFPNPNSNALIVQETTTLVPNQILDYRESVENQTSLLNLDRLLRSEPGKNPFEKVTSTYFPSFGDFLIQPLAQSVQLGTISTLPNQNSLKPENEGMPALNSSNSNSSADGWIFDRLRP